MNGVDAPRGRLSHLPAAIAWRGCAAVSTFVSDFSPRAAPVIASASFLALANVQSGLPRPRRAVVQPIEVERAHVAALLRGGLSGA